MDNIDKFKVYFNISIRLAIKQMDEGGIGFCVCVNEDETILGVVSDGDFRRAILNGIQLDEPIERIMNRNYQKVNTDYTKTDIEEIFTKGVVQHVPVMKNRKLMDIITVESFYGKKIKNKKLFLSNPVVIMAGGKGTRLDPFTRVLPKPLIPLGEEPIIKVIIDHFSEFGMKDFYITLNDKGKMIKAYFSDYDAGYNLSFVEESKPMGTAGSLKLLKVKLSEPFFVSNCDTIIKCNYGDILKLHTQRGNALTLVGSMQRHTVPYGVCEIENEGDLISIHEKPQYDFLTNAGLYILEPEVLNFVPEDAFFNMTDLITAIQDEGLKVGVFPVSEKSWIDVGQWSEYKKFIENY